MNNIKTFYGDVFLDAEDLNERGAKYPIELEYYKIYSSRRNIINEDYEVYGVEIIKKEYIDGKIEMESSQIENITRNEDILNKIMKILKDNTVTPITLKDVINDMFIT